MILSLEQGILPEQKKLRSRMKAALVKKGGVLNMPPHCRPMDPKINPSALHLFWAAILTGDSNDFAAARNILFFEHSEHLKKGANNLLGVDGVAAQALAAFLDRMPAQKTRAHMIEMARAHGLEAKS